MAVPGAAADPAWRPDLGPPWTVPLVLAPSFTAHRLLSLHEALEGAGLPSPLRGRVDGVTRADDDPAALIRAHVGGYVQRARDALRAHETQIDPTGHWFAVPVEVVESVYPYEDFIVLASEGGVASRFEIFEPFRAEPQRPEGSS
jgi:mycothiol S-conjugate amidase